ncbi:MAG: ABC transporter permease [Promethearchaeota archaeon]
MEKIDELVLFLKPIAHTYIFELKQRWKKFVIFSIIIGLFGLLSVIGYVLFPENSLPKTQAQYFEDELGLIILINIFSVCFFFGGIICTEYSKKTGYVVFPKINKYKLITGKYLGALTLVIGVTGVFYYVLGLLGLYFYGGPITSRLYLSFGIACLYVLAVSSFVTLISSFMRNANITIVTTILMLLIGFYIIASLVVLWNPDIEPLYSLNYLSNLITSVLRKDFPKKREDRYEDYEEEDFTYRDWITPSIGGGITGMILYAIICMALAMVIFKRRQL